MNAVKSAALILVLSLAYLMAEAVVNAQLHLVFLSAGSSPHSVFAWYAVNNLAQALAVISTSAFVGLALAASYKRPFVLQSLLVSLPGVFMMLPWPSYPSVLSDVMLAKDMLLVVTGPVVWTAIFHRLLTIRSLKAAAA